MIHVQAGSYKQLGKLIADLGKKEARAAMSRAISRASKTVTVEAVKEIRKRKLVKLPAGDLKAMFQTRTQIKGDIRAMFAVVSISNKAINYARFWARRVSPPSGKQRVSKVGHGHRLQAVRVTVMGRTQLAGGGNAFLVDKNGGMIFMRTGPKRTPIRKLYGPSVSDMVIALGLQSKLQGIATERFQTVLAQELAYRTSKLQNARR